MKRILAFCLAIILCLGILPILPESSAQAETVATVKGGWLKLRAEPSTASAVLGSYYTGTSVAVLGKVGAWSHVRLGDGKIGYMMSSYLTTYPGEVPDTPSTETPPPSQQISAWVTSENGKAVRLRSGPSTSYSSLGSYAVGTAALIVSPGTTWHKVIIGGKTGYMMSQFLTTTRPSTPPETEQPPVTPTPVPPTTYTAYVTSSNGKSVNMRSGAGTGYSRIASYPVGTPVTVLAEKNGWANITVNGKTGWMMMQYLTRTAPGGSTTTPPTTPTDLPTTPTNLPTQAPTQTPAPTPTGSYTAYVTSNNGGSVNMRKSASKGAAVVAQLAVGTPVTVIHQTGEWLYIRYGSLYGYMLFDYLTYQAPSATDAPSYTAYVISGNGKSVNMRSGAGSGYSVIASLPVNTEVLVLARWNDAWCKVKANGMTGFIMTQYLTTVAPSEPKAIVGVALSKTAPAVNDTLSAVVTPAEATFSCQWFNGAGTLLSTSKQYTVTAADVGSQIYVVVAGTGAYSGSSVSALSSPVTAAPSGPEEKIQLKGISLNLSEPPYVNQTLTAVLEPANATADFLWWRPDGTVLSNTSTYTVKAADEGQCIYVRAIGTGNTEGTIVITTPNVRLWPLEEPRVFTATVTIPETADYTYTLYCTVSNSTFSLYTYHWYVDGVEVSNENKLKPDQDMVGKQIVLKLRPKAGYGYTGEAVSNVCTVVGFQ